MRAAAMLGRQSKPIAFQSTGGQAEVAGGAEDVGAASTVGRAEEANRGAEDVLKSGIAAGKLFANAARALDGEPGMGDGVVADEVAGGLDFADEVRDAGERGVR